MNTVRVTLEVPADMPILDLLNGLSEKGYKTQQKGGLLVVSRPHKEPTTEVAE